MPKLKVNDIDIEVEDGLTVLQACEQAGAEIPRFVIMKNFPSLGIVVCVWLKWKNRQNL